MSGIENLEWYAKMGWKLPEGLIHPFDFEKIILDVSVGYEKERKLIFDYLSYGTGIMTISSPPGYGKTHLLSWLQKKLKDDKSIFPIIYYTPPESVEEFVKSVSTQLYINGLLDLPFFQKVANLFGSADNYLARITKADLPGLISKQKKTIVILCDEAQNADPRILNEFKVMRDHPDSGDKVRIILAGYKTERVDLFEKLEATIQDRVAPSSRILLSGISMDDARSLIEGRLKMVESDGLSLFEPHMKKIYEFSGGRPREVLKICKEVVDYCVMNNFAEIPRGSLSTILSKFVTSSIPEVEPKKTKGSADFSVLSENMMAIIKVLAEHPGSTKEEISKRTGLDPMTINTLIWRMSKDKTYLEKFARSSIPIPLIMIKDVKTKKRGRSPSVYTLSEQAKVHFAEV